MQLNQTLLDDIYQNKIKALYLWNISLGLDDINQLCYALRHNTSIMSLGLNIAAIEHTQADIVFNNEIMLKFKELLTTNGSLLRIMGLPQTTFTKDIQKFLKRNHHRGGNEFSLAMLTETEHKYQNITPDRVINAIKRFEIQFKFIIPYVTLNQWERFYSQFENFIEIINDQGLCNLDEFSKICTNYISLVKLDYMPGSIMQYHAEIQLLLNLIKKIASGDFNKAGLQICNNFQIKRFRQVAYMLTDHFLFFSHLNSQGLIKFTHVMHLGLEIDPLTPREYQMDERLSNESLISASSGESSAELCVQDFSSMAPLNAGCISNITFFQSINSTPALITDEKISSTPQLEKNSQSD